MYIDSLVWAKILFKTMGFVNRASTTGKVEIPDGGCKETALLFHHEIINYVEKYKILTSLVINFDQTSSKYAAVKSHIMAALSFKCVPIAGSTYKQAITAIFGVTLYNEFLPMQLIYEGNKSKLSTV